MIEPISLGEATWSATFPHRVMPFQDEWLPGLLLRCDEVNHWGSKTTLTHMLSLGPEKFHRCWRIETPNLIVIQPSALNLDALAQCLAISTRALLATTYHLEIARLYDISSPHPKLLNASYAFRLCPVCLREARLLRRTLILPYVTHCSQHYVALLGRCQCGEPLQLFHRQARPFACSTCGMDWAELPQIEAVSSQVEQEQKFLTWYEFFFSQGTPPLMHAALRQITGSSRERLSLDALVALLVQRGHYPQDVLRWMD